MRSYREKREAARRRQALQGTALIVGAILFGIILFPVFDWIDCRNTTRFAAAYEDCVLDDTCQPTSRQTWVYERERFHVGRCRLD